MHSDMYIYNKNDISIYKTIEFKHTKNLKNIVKDVAIHDTLKHHNNHEINISYIRDNNININSVKNYYENMSASSFLKREFIDFCKMQNIDFNLYKTDKEILITLHKELDNLIKSNAVILQDGDGRYNFRKDSNKSYLCCRLIRILSGYYKFYNISLYREIRQSINSGNIASVINDNIPTVVLNRFDLNNNEIGEINHYKIH